MIDKTQTNAVAIGVFDGVHRGHRRVIEQAAAQTGKTVACTFDTATISTKGIDFRPIYDSDTKSRLLRSLGIDEVYSLDFAQIKDLTGDTFFTEILYYRLRAHTIVCGRDFRFGRGAAFGTEELARLCSSHNIKLIAVDAVMDGENKISSAAIRKLISSGDISRANELLGSEYLIRGEIVQGNRIGTQMGFPTANIILDENFIVPAYGVYRADAYIDGVCRRAISNIGVKPTVGSKVPLCETHIPGISGDLYGKTMEVRLKGFIRPERRFSGTGELMQQIASDLRSL